MAHKNMTHRLNCKNEGPTGISARSEVIPNMAKILKTLLPTILPIATSELLRSAAITVVLNSGKEVSRAIKLSATTDSDTPHEDVENEDFKPSYLQHNQQGKYLLTFFPDLGLGQVK